MKQISNPMPENPSTILKAKITDKVYVYIKSIDKDVSLSLPVYAINWFNTNSLWLYNLYNILAAISVKKIGGKAFFKGRVQEIMLGNEAQKRDVLLIVHYPSASQFKLMLESSYFKLVSTLRILAVNKFTFGFTQRTDSQSTLQDHDKSKVYAIHHYQADHDITEKVEKIIEYQNIDIYYGGKISSLLFSGNSQEANEPVPCLMDGLLLMRTDTPERLKKLIRQEAYQAIIQGTESSFIATLERLL